MRHILLLVLVAASASAKNVIHDRQGKYCIVDLGSSVYKYNKMLGSMKLGMIFVFHVSS